MTNAGGIYVQYGYDDIGQVRVADSSNNDGVGRLRIRVEFAIPVQASTNPPQGPTIGLETPQDPWQFVPEAHYIYDGLRVIQERDGTNTPTASYTRGNDLSGSLEGAGGIGGLLARSDVYSSGNWTSHTCYHADGNGNITCLVDGSQSAVARYRYDAFGNTVMKLGPLADANIYRFSTKELHVASGMYYYPYRFYGPDLQRWMSRDPLAEPGFGLLRSDGIFTPDRAANLYCFVGNAPLGQPDPFGLQIFIPPPIVDPLPEPTRDPKKTHVECLVCTKPCGGPIVLTYIGCFMRRPNDKPMNPKAFENCMKQPLRDAQAACQSFNIAALHSANMRAKNCYDHHW